VRKIRESQVGTQTSRTLDSVHREIIQNMKDSHLTQDAVRKEIEEIRSKISELHAKNDLDAILEATKLQNRIQEIEKEVSTENPIEEYYLKNMDLLLDYYKKQDTPLPNSSVPSKDTNTFMKFFSTQSARVDITSSRKQMFDEYIHRMKLSNGPEATTQLTEHCSSCNVAREEITSEGILVCPHCGSEEYALVVSDFPSFRDPPKERNNYAYKKINHLNEILNQFQAKESTIIPDDVMNEVVLEIRKRRIANIADLTEEDIRQILKKLNRSKYYEHRAHILSRLNGNPPPTITPEIEEKIRAMFQEIQAPFLLYCPNDRTNFLSYSYILYKFFELLELDEYKAFFPLLKSRDRLIAHDTIWMKICEYLHWQFISSV